MRSLTKTHEHYADYAWIDAASEADPHLAWQLDMNRAQSRRSHLDRLWLRKLFVVSYADRQQFHRALGRSSQLAISIQAPSLEDLVRVDTMLQRHPSHGSTRLQRLLHNPTTLIRTATPTRSCSQHTPQIYVNHPHIITA